MLLPLQTQQLCLRYLESVRNDPEHNLNTQSRFELYRSFGPSRLDLPGYQKRGSLFNHEEYKQHRELEFANFTIADQVLGWLAVVTARKVLPVWERIWTQTNMYNDSTPQEILQEAENLLRGKAKLRNIIAKKVEGFNYPLEIWVSFDIALAYRAAYNALELITISPEYIRTFLENEDEVGGTGRNFASTAMKAYTFNETATKRLEITQTPITETDFDPLKRLEFWEWWLTEAIPQAWELAGQAQLYFQKISH